MSTTSETWSDFTTVDAEALRADVLAFFRPRPDRLDYEDGFVREAELDDQQRRELSQGWTRYTALDRSHVWGSDTPHDDYDC